MAAKNKCNKSWHATIADEPTRYKEPFARRRNPNELGENIRKAQKARKRRERELELRERYPAVKDAWERYQAMLKLHGIDNGNNL